MREKIYNTIEPYENESKASKAYDVIMIVTICLSLIPLLFEKQTPVLQIMDKVTVSIFIVDYILRLITADYKYNRHEALSFVRYPFSPMAIIDILTILPSITPLNGVFKALRVLRFLRALRVIRALRYSKSIKIIVNAVSKQRESLLAVLAFALGYVFVTAIMMYQVEPKTFNNFFEALYWATVSLTTVGYGDIFATTTVGRIFTMLSAFVGIAIVALPAGIITAGYLDELREIKEKGKKESQE